MLNVADSPQRHPALPVLDGLGGVGLEQPVGAAAIRARNRAELRLDESHRSLGVETARDHEDGVVGLVVLPVEGVQAFDGHVLDIGECAPCRVAVVVPPISRGQDALLQSSGGTVVPELQLVADHGLLRLKVFGGDVCIDHAVRFDVERPGEVVFVRRERLKEVGAVEPGVCVEGRATLVEFSVDLGMVRRALEEEVFKQVRHARFAVAFVPRTHQVGDVDGDLLLAPVGEKQEPKGIVESVLGDAFHGRDLCRSGRRRPGGCIVRFRHRGAQRYPERNRAEDEDLDRSHVRNLILCLPRASVGREECGYRDHDAHDLSRYCYANGRRRGAGCISLFPCASYSDARKPRGGSGAVPSHARRVRALRRRSG